MSSGWTERNGYWLIGALMSCVVTTSAVAHGCRTGREAFLGGAECTARKLGLALPGTVSCLKTTGYRECLDELVRQVGEAAVICAAEHLADKNEEAAQALLAPSATQSDAELLRRRADAWLIERYGRQ